MKNGMRQGTKGWKVRAGNVFKELGNAFSSGSLEDYLDETVTCMVQNSWVLSSGISGKVVRNSFLWGHTGLSKDKKTLYKSLLVPLWIAFSPKTSSSQPPNIF